MAKMQRRKWNKDIIKKETKIALNNQRNCLGGCSGSRQVDETLNTHTHTHTYT